MKQPNALSVVGPTFMIMRTNSILSRDTLRLIVKQRNGSLVLGIDELLSECTLLNEAWECQSPKGLRYIGKPRSLSELMNGCSLTSIIMDQALSSLGLL